MKEIIFIQNIKVDNDVNKQGKTTQSIVNTTCQLISFLIFNQ